MSLAACLSWSIAPASHSRADQGRPECRKGLLVSCFCSRDQLGLIDRQTVHHRCYEYVSTWLLGGKNLATRPSGRLVYVMSSRPYHQEEEIMQANPAVVTSSLRSITRKTLALVDAAVQEGRS